MTEQNISVAPVRQAGGTLRGDARAVLVVWRRELIRFFRARTRIVTSLAQPLLFLFVLGTGLSPLIGDFGSGAVDFRTFMFPGVIAMTVLFTAIFSAMSIVWDREFGFLREMLVAPVRRSALLLGKCLGGATVATLQGAIILALAGLVGVPYSPLLLLILLVEMALAAFMLTCLGMLVASRIQEIESFQVVMQFLVLPMFFLSGAVFPLSGLPGWLQALAAINPLSYAVDPMRRAVFGYVSASPATMERLNPGISSFGWQLPVGVELGIVALIAAALLAVAVRQFARAE